MIKECRIGIDVGGTHTDAVLLSGTEILASTKSLTTKDVFTGITNALDEVLLVSKMRASDIAAVMLGTTQFTNAIVERKELSRVAALRVGLPSGDGIAPMLDWPEDLCEAINGLSFMLPGGYLFDGRLLAELDYSLIDDAIEKIRTANINKIAIASVFSPMNPKPEIEVAEYLQSKLNNLQITLSHKFNRLGILERENAAILNASLLDFADKVVNSFRQALEVRQFNCPIFVSQNDGTLMDLDFVKEFPALTFSSGPTNSLRGAYRLTGLEDAIVVDIGGTTSDIGVLQQGFPRESNNVIQVGGVRTNFRMPDIEAVGLGGGSIIQENGLKIGPSSVGHRLVTESLVFGGSTLTTTDILVASKGLEIGNPKEVEQLSPELIENAETCIQTTLDHAIERMKPGGKALPVILVGGGSIIVTRDLKSATKVYRPANAEVANALGAAIAQVGGEAELMIKDKVQSRSLTIEQITQIARQKALKRGAKEDTLRIVDIEEVQVPYMNEPTTRIRIKVVGELDLSHYSQNLSTHEN